MWYQRQGNKYGASKKEYNGRIYMSKGEAGVARDLELRKRIGEIREITPQFRLPLDVNGYHICNYIVDFKCDMVDGTIEMVEAKGFATEIWRMKWKLAEALYQDIYKF